MADFDSTYAQAGPGGPSDPQTTAVVNGGHDTDASLAAIDAALKAMVPAHSLPAGHNTNTMLSAGLPITDTNGGAHSTDVDGRSFAGARQDASASVKVADPSSAPGEVGPAVHPAHQALASVSVSVPVPTYVPASNPTSNPNIDPSLGGGGGSAEYPLASAAQALAAAVKLPHGTVYSHSHADHHQSHVVLPQQMQMKLTDLLLPDAFGLTAPQQQATTSLPLHANANSVQHTPERRTPSTDDLSARALHALAEVSAASERQVGPAGAPTSRPGSTRPSVEQYIPRNGYPPEFAFTALRSSLAYVPVGGPRDRPELPYGGPNEHWPYRNTGAPPGPDGFPQFDGAAGLVAPPPPGYVYGAAPGPQGPQFPQHGSGPFGPADGMLDPTKAPLAGEQFASHILGEDPSLVRPQAVPEPSRRRGQGRVAQPSGSSIDDGEQSSPGSKRGAKDGARKSVPRPKSGCYTCRIRRKKCDEHVDENGSCQTCTRLRLECLGFGRKRPEWLRDGAALNATRERIREFLAAQGLIKGQFGPASAGAGTSTPRPAVERPPVLGLIPDHLRGVALADEEGGSSAPPSIGPGPQAGTLVDDPNRNAYAQAAEGSFFGPPPGIAGGAYAYPPGDTPPGAPPAQHVHHHHHHYTYAPVPEGGVGVLPPLPADAARMPPPTSLVGMPGATPSGVQVFGFPHLGPRVAYEGSPPTSYARGSQSGGDAAESASNSGLNNGKDGEDDTEDDDTQEDEDRHHEPAGQASAKTPARASARKKRGRAAAEDQEQAQDGSASADDSEGRQKAPTSKVRGKKGQAKGGRRVKQKTSSV